MAETADRTRGQFTTGKLQALLDAGYSSSIRNRRDLAAQLKSLGARISVHGVEAWFRRVDSNYNHPRDSLHNSQPSFAVPARHWPLLLELFDLPADTLELGDDEFSRFALERRDAGKATELLPLDTSKVAHLPGREWEAGELLRELQQCASGSARMVLLEGGAGIGKTSLIEELVKRARGAGFVAVTASCTEDAYLPLLPLLDLVRLHLDEIARSGTEAVTIARNLSERIEQAHQEEADGELFLMGSELLVVLARSAPLLVVIDDVHWLDAATQALLVHFAQFLRFNRQHRVLLLFAGREFTPGLVHRLPRGEFSRHMTLQPLGFAAMRAVARRLLGAELGPQAREFIWAITEGNPLYVEQLTDHLARSHQLVGNRGQMELARPVDAIHVPDSLDDFYRQTFAALDDDAARLLQLAACMGRQVHGEFLQFLVPGVEIADLFAALGRAEQAGLLKFVQNRYEFSHPVARHTVYVTNSEAQRARLHARIAQAIDVSLPERSPHASIELAYHLVRGRPHSPAAKTLEVCCAAAEHSHRLAAWPSSEYFSTAALELDDELDQLSADQRGTLLRLRGSSKHLTARPAVALQDLEAALERFQAGQNTVEYARTLGQVVRIKSNFVEVREGRDEAAEELGEYIELLSESDRGMAARGLEVLASYRLANNDSKAALRIAERAIEDFRDNMPSRELAQSQITAGIACVNHLDLHGGLKWLLAATRTARESNHEPTLARALQRLLLAQVLMGRLDDAVSSQEELDKLGNTASATGERSTVCLAMGAAQAVLGDSEQALAQIDDGLELVDVTGYRFMETGLVSAKVFNLLHTLPRESAGEPQLAGWLPATEAIARLDRDRPRRAAQILRACVALAQYGNEPAGRGAEPIEESLRVSALAEQSPDLNELPRILMLAELAIATKDAAVLEGLLAKLQLAETGGVIFATAWPVQLPLLLGRVCLALGRDRDAHSYFRQSLTFGRANKLPAQLHQLQNALLLEWPTETQLHDEVAAALAAL